MLNEPAFSVAVAEVENLIQQVAQLEQQFIKLHAVIDQLQQQRDIYKALYEATL